jgi:hypothetical protein
MTRVKDGITRYFLRIYAQELRRSERGRGWGPFGEAVYQTVLIVLIPLVGVCAAAIVLLMTTSQEHRQWLLEYRVATIACVATVPLLAAFVLVKGLVWSYRGARADALEFGTRRDLIITNMQFWAVLLGSLALPWIAALSVHLAQRSLH